MADVYATITDADPALVAQIAEVLELRAADPQQAAMRRAYLGDIQFPTGASVLAEARRRSAAGRFFGHVAYVSLVATLPGQGPT